MNPIIPAKTQARKSSPGRRLSHVSRLAACLRAAALPKYFFSCGAAKRLSPVTGQDARCDHVARDGGFVIPARATSPRRDFFRGLADALIIGGTMLMILVLAGCQSPRSTSPGLEAAGASAATIDGTLDTIGYHAAKLREGLK